MANQPSRSTCFTCGEHNPAGVHVQYDKQEDGSVLARFAGQEHHQGYPGRMHGGITAAILSETIGRTIAAQGTPARQETTEELRVRYRQPVPLNVELVAVGRSTSTGERVREGAAELRLPDGTVAVEAQASFRVLDPEQRGDPDLARGRWAAETAVKKQPNSRMCFVCGTSNFAGLKVRFYEQADNGVLARFTSAGQHTDDAGRLSLAAIAAVMDEAMGRAIMIPYGEAIWGVTAELSFRILRPAPVGVELAVAGRIINEKSRLFEGSGELLLPDGTIAVEGYGRYVKLDMVALGGFDPAREEWGVRPD
jgi:acyl-coenzyme A thioesterase PaaI-like protein